MDCDGMTAEASSATTTSVADGPTTSTAAAETTTTSSSKHLMAGDHERTLSVAGTHSFQALLDELPRRISKTLTKNLSVPIAFVCLLHLANEKVGDMYMTL